eukprot:snap_masked-scaffold_1-processed-gene-3.21-mRNA-1 protein AED:1.00 eAED:1.00 QI:0/-1/0/0/-1/1/1/0/81
MGMFYSKGWFAVPLFLSCFVLENLLLFSYGQENLMSEHLPFNSLKASDILLSASAQLTLFNILAPSVKIAEKLVKVSIGFC